MGEVIVSVHQPNFLPWIKLLDKILASDVYVVYDTAQFTKSEYHARQKVKTHTGPVWLSVPVLHARGTRQRIDGVRIDNSQPFRQRHLKVLRMSYSATPYFDDVFPILDEVYGRNQENLVDLNTDLIEALCSYLGAEVRVVRASSVPHSGDRTERLVTLVSGVGGTAYVTSTVGPHGPPVDWSMFERAGLGVRSHRFDHPVYDQIGPGFVAGLSAVDMVFTCGLHTVDILADRRRLADVPCDHRGQR